MELKDLDEKCPSELNRDSFSYLGFHNKVKFDEYLNLCSGLGASDHVPESESHAIKIGDSFQDLSGDTCNNKFWVPIRQSGGGSDMPHSY